MSDVLSDLIAEGQRVERERNGKALTPEDVKTLKALAFLRKIAPYAFTDETPTPRPKA